MKSYIFLTVWGIGVLTLIFDMFAGDRLRAYTKPTPVIYKQYMGEGVTCFTVFGIPTGTHPAPVSVSCIKA